MKIIPVLIIIWFLLPGCQRNKHNELPVKLPKKEYTLRIKVANIQQKRIVLTTLFGHNQDYADSSIVNVNGVAVFKFTDKSRVGMYRLLLGKDLKTEFFGGQETYIDIIFNYEDIELGTDFYHVIDSLNITVSEENKEYYEFLKNENKANMQLDILEQLVQFFPKEDEFYPQIKTRFEKISRKQKVFTGKLIREYPNTLATRIIKSRTLPDVDFEMKPEEKKNYLKTHYFDHVDFGDTLLLYTNVISSKAVDFIKLYLDRNLDKPAQDKAYCQAVDTLMAKSRKSNRMYNYIRSYILAGFEKLDNEELMGYILEKYPETDRCEDDKQTKNIRLRIEGSKKLPVGGVAPVLKTMDVEGSMVTYDQVKTDYTLLIFWASWCPHCQQILPRIRNIYDSQNPKKIEIIAFSIDTVKKDWVNFIKNNDLKWINCSDLKGWNSKTALDYYIYATPTMFLLDRNRKIVAKPIRFEELVNALSQFK